MGVALSLLLIAIGAVLAFAVTYETAGIDLEAAGVILMVIGGLGLVLSLILWNSLGTWLPSGYRRGHSHAAPAPAPAVQPPPVVIHREVPVVHEVERTVTRDAGEAVIIEERTTRPGRH